MPNPNEMKTLTAAAGTPRLNLLNRDVSILAFNERVLDLATQTQTPLLERLRTPINA